MYSGRSFWGEHLVCCPEFRGGRFSEVANVLHVKAFQSVTGLLAAVGSVSASRTVRSERFDCIALALHSLVVAAYSGLGTRLTYMCNLIPMYMYVRL